MGNITTLNMTTLDGGVIIKKGEGGGGTPINNQDKVVDITENGTTEVVADGGYTGLGKVTINTEVSGGGGELDGEYFLAKPNGRYWKSKFAKMLGGKYPVINNYNGEVFTDEQVEIIHGYCTLFALFGYTAIYDYGGSPSSGIEVILQTPNEVSKRAGIDKTNIELYEYEERTLVSFMGAWQECNSNPVIGGINFEGGLVDFIRLAFGSEIGPMTDDEVLTFISEMFMLEQITKEEYESYYNW